MELRRLQDLADRHDTYLRNHFTAGGFALVANSTIQLTPILSAIQGAVWGIDYNRFEEWHLSLVLHAAGEGTSDFGVWYTKTRLKAGATSGSQEDFEGLKNGSDDVRFTLTLTLLSITLTFRAQY